MKQSTDRDSPIVQIIRKVHYWMGTTCNTLFCSVPNQMCPLPHSSTRYTYTTLCLPIADTTYISKDELIWKLPIQTTESNKNSACTEKPISMLEVKTWNESSHQWSQCWDTDCTITKRKWILNVITSYPIATWPVYILYDPYARLAHPFSMNYVSLTNVHF